MISLDLPFGGVVSLRLSESSMMLAVVSSSPSPADMYSSSSPGTTDKSN